MYIYIYTYIHNYIYIPLTLLLQDLSTLCVMDHLAMNLIENLEL